MRKITEPQKKVFIFIEKFIRDNGYSPTVREIGDYFSITPKGAYDFITALIKKGYVKNQYGKARTITIVQKGGDNGSENR